MCVSALCIRYGDSACLAFLMSRAGVLCFPPSVGVVLPLHLIRAKECSSRRELPLASQSISDSLREGDKELGDSTNYNGQGT